MVRLLIPVQHQWLTGEVQRILLLAWQQGFDISQIQLDVSRHDLFQLEGVNDNEESLLIQTNLSTGAVYNTERKADWRLDYYPDTDNETRIFGAGSIVIGRCCSNQTYDEWFDQSSLRRLKTTPLSDSEKSQHLAWLLVCLSLRFPIEDCLVLARAALNVSRETWPAEASLFCCPELEEHLPTDLEFPPVSVEELSLYPVVDHVSWIETLLKTGVKTVQLRIKDSSCADLEAQIQQAIRLGREYHAQVFINDHWELAIKHGAFGVHLGQEDIEIANLKKICNAGIALGLSTHGYYELLRISQLKPSYIALGHIFPTTTKVMPSKPQGLVRLKCYQQLLNTLEYREGRYGIPSVAIGGIDLTNVDEVLACEVDSIAVVRAITLAEDVHLVINHFKLRLSSRSKGKGGVNAE